MWKQEGELTVANMCCDTCAHKADESRDDEGNRIVDCEINEFQMYSPYAEECVHWESADSDLFK